MITGPDHLEDEAHVPGGPVPVPTRQQLAWQRAGFGMFCHFGVNTFNGCEWSDGTLSPATFEPEHLDARQWVQSAVDADMRYLVLTAKHHDGFCLWPTETTGYSVASSPWRSGKGDVVAEVAEACEQAGIGLGLYLSPWDRNAPCYADPPAYNAFYVRQLTELCTRYGPLCELWFDGAGSQGRTYDWDAIMAVAQRHQPEAMIFNMGRPTIRWIGNEDGLADDPCHYAVERTVGSIGSDRALEGQPRYLPPECDVPIRDGWFWHPDNMDTLKTRAHLLEIYDRSFGLGANLLLNVPPDRRGLLDDADVARLLETTTELRRRYAEPVRGELSHEAGTHGCATTVRFDRPTAIDHLWLREDLTGGQRITRHAVYACAADGTAAVEPVASGGTVGIRRFHTHRPVTAHELRIEMNDPLARLSDVMVYRRPARGNG